MKSHRHLLAVAGLLLGSSAVYAHRVWVLPSMTVLSGTDQWVSFEAAVSNNLFFPNHRPVSIESIEVRGPDGAPVQIENAVGGQVRSSFELHLEKQGTYVISLKPSTGRRPSGGSAPAAMAQKAGGPPAGGQKGAPGGGSPKMGFGGEGSLFGSYEEDGKVQRWRGTPESLIAEGVAKKPGFKLRETGGRRVVTFVTCGKPSTEVLKPEGKGVEIDFLTHPNDLFVGEAAKFRLLVDGKPALNAEVTVVKGDDRYRDEAGDINLRTDANGVVEVKWPETGRYWFEATASSPGTLHGVPSEKSFTYIATFEVLPN